MVSSADTNQLKAHPSSRFQARSSAHQFLLRSIELPSRVGTNRRCCLEHLRELQDQRVDHRGGYRGPLAHLESCGQMH